MASQSNSIMLLLSLAVIVSISTFSRASGIESLEERLLSAAERDDTQAYRQLREEALALPDETFGALIDALAAVDSWQAMAMREGLQLRRAQPEMAAEFDRLLEEIANNPVLARGGNLVYMRFSRIRPGIDTEIIEDLRQVDPLRFEALLAVKAVDDPYATHDDLRKSLLGFEGLDADALGRFVALLEDNPQWVGTWDLYNGIQASSREIGTIDPYVPRLVKQYPQLRREFDRVEMDHMRTLIRALGRASPEVGLPALREIEQFERKKMVEQGFAPWDDDMEALRASRSADYARLREVGRLIEMVRDEHVAQFEREARILRDRIERTKDRRVATHLWDTLQEALSEMTIRAESERVRRSTDVRPQGPPTNGLTDRITDGPMNNVTRRLIPLLILGCIFVGFIVGWTWAPSQMPFDAAQWRAGKDRYRMHESLLRSVAHEQWAVEELATQLGPAESGQYPAPATNPRYSIGSKCLFPPFSLKRFYIQFAIDENGRVVHASVHPE